MDDRLSVTETDKGGIYEKDRQTNRQKNGNVTEIDQIYKIFFSQVQECVISFDQFQWHFHVFFALFYLSVSEARPLSVSVALGPSIRFTGTSSIMNPE